MQTHKVIFVLGAPRSGTTLLINMLVMNQSKIYGYFGESQFYTTTYRKPYTVDTFLNDRYFKAIINEEETKTIFSRSKDHIEFFKNTIEHCLQREGKNIFAEKSPMHTLFYKDILNDFPNAEFMIIHRNFCANVQSIAFTRWIPLASDVMPTFIKENKTVRYFFATLLFYHYWKLCKVVEQHPACKLSLQYEDIIMEKVNVREELKKALGFEPDEVFVSRPFSDAVTHKNYSFDTSRVEDYKNKMPKSIQNFINSVFQPSGLWQHLTGGFIRYFIFEPVEILKKLAGKK
ncbi:MAG: sulfotransferase [Bacteroidota bacterium]